MERNQTYVCWTGSCWQSEYILLGNFGDFFLKTSLLECFQNNNNKISKHTGLSTDGIQMSEWNPNNKERIKFRCW